MIFNNTQQPVYTIIKNTGTYDVHLRGLGPIRSAIVPAGGCIAYPGCIFDQVMPRQLSQLQGHIKSGSLTYILAIRTSADKYTAVQVAQAGACLTDAAAAQLVGVQRVVPAQAIRQLQKKQQAKALVGDAGDHVVIANKSGKLMSSLGATPVAQQPYSRTKLNQDNSATYGFTNTTAQKQEVVQPVVQDQYADLRNTVDKLYAENNYQAIVNQLKQYQLKNSKGQIVKVTRRMVLNAKSFAQLQKNLDIV